MIPMKNRQKDQGVTFIELLVSIIILATTIAAIFNLFASAKRWIEVSHSRMTMGEIGKLVLDPLQMQVRQDLWGTNCLSNPAACAAAPIQIQGRNYNVNYFVENDLPITNINRVRVTLTWTNEPNL
jgi:ABC-type phosphate transport system permease subunit